MPEEQQHKSEMPAPGFKPVFERILRAGQAAGEVRRDVAPELIAEMFHTIYQAAAFSKLPVPFQEECSHEDAAAAGWNQDGKRKQVSRKFAGCIDIIFREDQ